MPVVRYVLTKEWGKNCKAKANLVRYRSNFGYINNLRGLMGFQDSNRVDRASKPKACPWFQREGRFCHGRTDCLD